MRATITLDRAEVAELVKGAVERRLPGMVTTLIEAQPIRFAICNTPAKTKRGGKRK